MTTGTHLVLLMVVSLMPPAADPSALVRQLGAPRFAEREAASRALEALGAEALPALRAARAARDPEIRARAAVLRDRIENALLVQPTQVRFDTHAQSLEELVRAIAEQTGQAIALFPERHPAWQAARVVIEPPGPMPFWEAIDRVCEAGQLRFDLGALPLTDAREPRLGVLLSARDGSALGPTSDRGPFRVKLVSLHYQRDHRLDRAPGEPIADATRFHAQIQVMAEPRLMIAQHGNIRLLEAVDDAGRSLLPPSGSEPPAGFDPLTGLDFVDFHPRMYFQVPLPLRYPEQPGRTIRRLRGVVPVAVAARKAGPLVVPLTAAEGRTFRNEEVALEVHRVRRGGDDARITIELTVRSDQELVESAIPGLEEGLDGANRLAPELLDSQIDVRDARDRVLLAFIEDARIEEGEARLSLVVMPDVEPFDPAPDPPNDRSPMQLLFYSLSRATTEVPFTFTNVLMP